METAERDGLDFAIGSKRHPDSKVIYPRSRVVASWLYQQFVRLFFRLDVRDTQVGIKVFRREVAKEVMPLLLVKRYAFDVELLAVSRAFGYGRVKEMPISLDYRFTGSGVRSMAVAHALVDTLAVFYRLRILGFYQRRAASLRHFAWNVESDGIMPLVTAIDASGDTATRRIEAEEADRRDPRLHRARRASLGELALVDACRSSAAPRLRRSSLRSSHRRAATSGSRPPPRSASRASAAGR